MARISGVDIPREKRLEISLTYVFGDRPNVGAEHLRRDRASTPTRGSATSPNEEVNRIRAYIDTELKVEGDLQAARSSQDIKRKMEIQLLPGHPAPQGPSLCTVSAPTPTPGPARAPRRPIAGKKKVVSK